ncbi:unnamed protein product, partial [Anisakis simplex]|uniref:DUF4806 domain-containing protein n=1 Tax=Anisakis simplex TaxID=6269 RepID=A0A0M3K544_ANISI
VGSAQPTVADDEKIVVSCDAVYSRGYYSNSTDDDFSIAFVRVVYKDYHLQELMFNLMYSPINTYCYSIDKKATKIFHEQMQNLSKCFSNVYISMDEYNVDSAGRNIDRSYLDCLKIVRKLPDWKYAIVLQSIRQRCEDRSSSSSFLSENNSTSYIQNHDIPLKTNREMIMILKALNGSNNIELVPPFQSRIPKFDDWSFRALSLFRGPGRELLQNSRSSSRAIRKHSRHANDLSESKENDNRTLNIGKGSTGAALSRSFVEFVVDKLNLTTLLQRFDTVGLGCDEMLLPSLNSEDALDAPGGYTRKCLHANVSFITRYVVWVWSRLPCYSRRFRHYVCIFGIGDLKHLRESRYLFGNKMMPEIDYGVISCWAKELHHRIIQQQNHTVDLNYYSNLRTVIFNNFKQRWRSDMKAFNCTG